MLYLHFGRAWREKPIRIIAMLPAVSLAWNTMQRLTEPVAANSDQAIVSLMHKLIPGEI